MLLPDFRRGSSNRYCRGLVHLGHWLVHCRQALGAAGLLHCRDAFLDPTVLVVTAKIENSIESEHNGMTKRQPTPAIERTEPAASRPGRRSSWHRWAAPRRH